METEQRTITDIAEDYAKKLYHFLKTDQTQTIENHLVKPEVEGFDFKVEVSKAFLVTLHWTYMNEHEEFIQKKRHVI